MFLPMEILLIEDDSDRCFMEQLYINNEKSMYYWAYRYLKNKEDASDAVHTACISLIKCIGKLRGFDEHTLHSYVISTIRNAAIDLYRKRARQNEFMFSAGDDVIDSLSDNGSIGDDIILLESKISMKEALNTLPINESNLLRWKYFDGLTDQDIAMQLNIKAVSVRVYLTKARRHLSKILTEEAKND